MYGINLANNQLDTQFFFHVCLWSIQTRAPDGHLYTVTYTGFRIDTTDSRDDRHAVAPKHVGN